MLRCWQVNGSTAREPCTHPLTLDRVKFGLDRVKFGLNLRYETDGESNPPYTSFRGSRSTHCNVQCVLKDCFAKIINLLVVAYVY